MAVTSDRNSSGLSVNWCRIENLLSAADYRALFDEVVLSVQEFEPSRTLTSSSGHRRSRILRYNAQFVKDFVVVLRRCLPVVLPALGISEFDPSGITAQVTAHHDGDYYRAHRDNGHPDVAHRVVSFVYYLHAWPRCFEGGDLVFYASEDISTPALTVTPEANSVVFFDSSLLHEVRPVSSHSVRFEDSRFAINGWFSR